MRWTCTWRLRKLSPTGLNKSICGCKKAACEDSSLLRRGFRPAFAGAGVAVQRSGTRVVCRGADVTPAALDQLAHSRRNAQPNRVSERLELTSGAFLTSGLHFPWPVKFVLATSLGSFWFGAFSMSAFQRFSVSAFDLLISAFAINYQLQHYQPLPAFALLISACQHFSFSAVCPFEFQ